MKMTTADDLVNHFGETHREILGKAEEFERALTNLHYEGKPSIGKNLRVIRDLFRYFNGPFKRHMSLEETVVYPFFETHVPKFSPIIQLLRSEHLEIRHRLRVVTRLYRSFLQRGKFLEKLDSEGKYLIHLIRNHIQTETQSVFKAIVHHLTYQEISSIGDLIQQATQAGKFQGSKKARVRS